MSVVGFLDNKTQALKAAKLDGLLMKVPSKRLPDIIWWELRDGKMKLILGDIFHAVVLNNISLIFQCQAAAHVAKSWCTKDTLYESYDGSRVDIFYNGSNVHTVELQGILTEKNRKCHLQDSDGNLMPIGAAFKKLNERLVTISLENLNMSSISIMNCTKVVY